MKPQAVLFKRMLAIGVGLIGGSICLSARKQGLVGHTLGYSRKLETTHDALKLGLIDECVTSPGDAGLRSVDAVVLAVPVQQYRRLLTEFLPVLSPNCLVFDAGSTKTDVQAVVDDLESEFPGLRTRFVGVHPIAGGEKNGPIAARADLFLDKNCVLCPGAEVPAATVQKVEAFWQGMGAKISHMNPLEHDEMFGAVSHLPHLLAFAYVAALLNHPKGKVFMKEGGAGFRDFTRIAASSPEMWADIFENNDKALLHMLDGVEATLKTLRLAIETKDRKTLEQALAGAAEYRKHWNT